MKKTLRSAIGVDLLVVVDAISKLNGEQVIGSLKLRSKVQKISRIDQLDLEEMLKAQHPDLYNSAVNWHFKIKDCLFLTGCGFYHAQIKYIKGTPHLHHIVEEFFKI